MIAGAKPPSGPAIGDIDLRLLRVFRAVVERGGLSAAQVELGLGLATISKHLADLETRLGMRLCARGHEKFRLTDQGEVVYGATLELFASIEHLRQQVGAARQEMIAEITIGVVDGIVTDPTPPVVRAIAELRRLAPRVSLRVVVASPDDIEVGLLNGRLTMGLMPFYQQLPGLEYVPLYEEASDLYCATGHPLFKRADQSISPDELANQAYVGRGYVESPTKLRVSQGLTQAATAWQVEGVALLILSGGYVGFLPVHYAGEWCRAGRMRALMGGALRYTTPFCLAHRRSLKFTRPVAFVIDLMKGGPVTRPARRDGRANAARLRVDAST
jgi:LysR family transcriptional regulator, transcriptional activator for bauABCD operon